MVFFGRYTRYNILKKKPKGVPELRKAKDGELYKVISLGGKEFEIRYGYYEDYERESGEPIPIYPDFIKNPCKTDDGRPFVTQMQAICEYGTSSFEDGFCVDCKHFVEGEELIGICGREE